MPDARRCQENALDRSRQQRPDFCLIIKPVDEFAHCKLVLHHQQGLRLSSSQLIKASRDVNRGISRR
jgi:hypothetical protein